MASRSKRYRTRRRFLLLAVVGGLLLALSKPSDEDFDAYVGGRFPVASAVDRTSPVALTGRRDYVLFSVHGVQTVTRRRHYVGACGRFWEI